MADKKLKTKAPAMTFEDKGGVTDKNGVFFRPTKEGVFMHVPDRAERKICDRLDVLGVTRTKEGDGWGLLVSFDDPMGNAHELNVSRADIVAGGSNLLKRLTDQGLSGCDITSNGAKSPVAQYLNAFDLKKLPKLLAVRQAGWTSEEFGCFLFGNERITAKGAERAFLVDGADASNLTIAGDLAQWQAKVGQMALHSQRMMFALCVAFSGVLLPILREPSSLFHFYCTSGKGKSSILKASASVFGGSDRVQEWKSTDNGVEGVATKNNHQLIVLDELRQATKSALQNAPYLVGNNTGKVRAGRDGKLRKLNTWRVSTLSAGEETLEATRRRVLGKEAEGLATGERVRFVEIPADAGKGLGVLESVPEGMSAKQIVDGIGAFEATGSAGKAFIQHVADDIAGAGVEGFRQNLNDVITSFEAMQGGLSTDEARVLRRFAVVACAGELAISYGILPWEEGKAIESALTCFNAWRESDENPSAVRQGFCDYVRQDPSINEKSYHHVLLSGLKGEATGIEPPKNAGASFGIVADVCGGRITVMVCGQFDDLMHRSKSGLSRPEALQALKEAGMLLETKENGREGYYRLMSSASPFNIPSRKRVRVIFDGMTEADAVDFVEGRK